jgi:Icc-related predicted phosphoesterase
MAAERVSRVLCAAAPAGSAEALDAVLAAGAERGAHALALVGDLGADDFDSLRSVFKALARGSLPTYWVPGAGDAPMDHYLREAANIEVVAPFLRGVHGTMAFAPGQHVLFAGFGGEVSDDLDGPRDEHDRLSYPRWEPEYRLKLVRELDEHELVLLFATPPAHKGLGTGGAEVLAELIGTHRPRLVVCGGERGTEQIGRSVIVAPGRLTDGHYAIADVNSQQVELEELPAAARSS